MIRSVPDSLRNLKKVARITRQRGNANPKRACSSARSRSNSHLQMSTRNGEKRKKRRWVLHELSKHKLGPRMSTCLSPLAKHQKKTFWSNCDGRWKKYNFFLLIPNARSYGWIRDNQRHPPPKIKIQMKKVLLCIWWDIKSILLLCHDFGFQSVPSRSEN